MWLQVMVIQLPGWVAGLTRRQVAWLPHGFFLPLRGASSKSKCQPGASAGVRVETCMCVPRRYVTPLYVVLFSYDDVDQNVLW